MHSRRLALAHAAVPLALPQTSNACTRLLRNGVGEPVITVRSMEFYMSDKTGLVIYPPDIELRSNDPHDPVSWTSHYDSAAITASDTATSDGMNEKGLSASLLTLSKPVHEAPDGLAP